MKSDRRKTKKMSGWSVINYIEQTLTRAEVEDKEEKAIQIDPEKYYLRAPNARADLGWRPDKTK